MTLLALGGLLVGCSRDDAAEVASDTTATGTYAAGDSAGATLGGAGGGTANRPVTPAAPEREVIVAVVEDSPGLLARAKVLPIDAQHLAQTKYPQGEVKVAELKYRGSDLVYSYYIQQPGVEGVEEVLIDAGNGAVITSIHRDAAVVARVLANRPPDR
jgi:hypothetical protein